MSACELDPFTNTILADFLNGMGIAAVLTGLDAAGKLGGKPITSADIDAEVERLKTKS